MPDAAAQVQRTLDPVRAAGADCQKCPLAIGSEANG